MIVYLETSVLLRRLLRQANPMTHWENWSKACTSEITRVEALRTVDRFRIQGKMNDLELAESIQNLNLIIRKTEILTLNTFILNRAAQPFPTVTRTLDAIHLASALLWQDYHQKELTFLTHDAQLGRVASAMRIKSARL